jgi:hypothetical protein
LPEVDRHGLGFGLKPLFNGGGEVAPIGGFHPTLGPSDQTLPLLKKLDLHGVIRAPRFGIHAALAGLKRA